MIEPLEEWTDTECWVWRQIEAGHSADLNEHLGETVNPNSPDGWVAERRLSAAFLQTIAFHEPYRSALPRNGIQIAGAWFDEPIDFRDGHLDGILWLEACRFEELLAFNGLSTASVISLAGSVFEGDVDMRSLEVEGGLYLRNGARFKAVNLYGARIGRNINLSRAVFTGRLIMNAVKIGGNIIGFESRFAADVGFKGASVEGMMDIRRCRFESRLDMWWLRTGQDLLMGGMAGDDKAPKPAFFQHLDCRNAKIGGELNLNHVQIAEKLNLSSITVTNEALLSYHSQFSGIDFGRAKIGQNLILASSHIDGPAEMTAIHVGQNLSFNEATLSGKVNLVFAQIDINLDLCNGHFQKLDLTGTKIAGELRFNDEVIWSQGGQLILRNTRADTLHDNPAGWPEYIELDGFVYNRFGGLGSDAESDLARRRAAWFIAWLRKNAAHTPHPSRQCANVLIDMGYPDLADDVLYAGRERDRHELLLHGDHLPALGLWLLKATIGYGHGKARYFLRTLYWFGLLTVLGTIVLMMTGDYCLLDGNSISKSCNHIGDGHGLLPWQEATGSELLINIVQAASFSLNKLLPIINLPAHHADVILGTTSKLYFQLHKLMGYVLALFLLAGIAGLTK